MLPRPRIRMPISLALAIAAGLYLARAALRGFDFRPDMPQDAVALVAFIVLLGAVAYVRHRYRHDPTDDAGEQDSGAAT